MISYKKQLISLVVAFLVLVAIFISIYSSVRNKIIAELNSRQMLYAQLAADGISESFEYHFKMLKYLAGHQDIIQFNSRGEDLLKTFQSILSSEIRGATRVDADGKIIFTFPYVAGMAGADISGQEHVQKILHTRQPVLSDVFVTAQGFQAVAAHVPVFEGEVFKGTVGFLVSFDALAKKYLADIKIEESGYAWVISEKGIEIFCPIPGHVGNSVFDNCKDFPDILEMARDMVKGKTGTTTYTFGQPVKGGQAVLLKKQAVYMPVRIANTFWSIVVATPENTVLMPMKNIRIQLMIVILLLILICAAIVYAMGRTHSAAVALDKRREMESDLIKSALEVQDLYHNAPCGYHSVDASGHLARINDTELAWLGYTREELIGKPYQQVLSPESHEVFITTFEKIKNEGFTGEVEYIMKRKDGTTFPVLVTVSSMTGEQGEFLMTRSMVQDITERRRQEERLRESETLYRTALEGTNDGITITNKDGKYVFVNKKLLNTIGRPDEDLVGKQANRFVHPDDRDILQSIFNEWSSGKPLPFYQYDVRIIKPDQSIATVDVRVVEIKYEGQPALLAFMHDITRLKQVETELRESEALYRTALETTSDGISIANIHTATFLYVNQRLLNTIGRPDENLVGQPASQYIHPDDLDLGRKAWQARREKGEPSSYYEQRVIRPDGSQVMLGMTSTDTVYKGKPAIITFISDITERKRAETLLKESEVLYRTTLETTNDGISISDIRNATYLYVNQRLMNTIGRPNENMVGLSVNRYTHPDDIDLGFNAWRDRKRTGETSSYFEQRVIKPDGSQVLLGVTSTDTVYQGKQAIITFVSDITEHKRAEEALRHSEERYRTIIESIDDDYFEADLRGNFTFLNKPVALSGYSREEMIGLNYRDYSSPKMVQKVEEVFKAIYQDGVARRVTDYQIRRKNGDICHMELSVSLIRDAAGKPVGFRGISRDVSDRIKMEEDSRKLTEQLYQAQKMEAIGTLAGGIAHDFNNLLMGIQGYTSIMLLEVDAAHPYYEQLKAVQALVQSGAGLTKQLLGFARAGRYEVKPTDINDLISTSVNLFGRTKKEIRIFEKYADHVRSVEVDRGQIEQVLLNLFVNAWQAMPGGGSLYLETENVVFDKTTADLYNLVPGHYVKVAVTDTGTGMDEKTRQRIFDPFFTTKEMGRGTGLGLASAYGIVKGHGGMITVYSEKGQGTTFHIYLPASLKKTEAEVLRDTTIMGGRETILLIDDEEVIADVTSRLLSELGYTILIAESGEKAVEIYKKDHDNIQLVILDMIMPGMSGAETFDQLKAIDPSVRTILSSGYSIDGKAQAIMQKGVRLFLQKPYRLHDLASKIREALSD